jgi:hypothetical protein
MLRRPAIEVVVAIAVMSGALAAVGPVAGAGRAYAGPACVAARPDVSGAAAMARSCGRRVEVSGQRSETSQLFAEPSGRLTIERAAAPVRVRTANGGWTGVDANLRRQADGGVRPAAVPLALRLSGGGTGPLVTFETARGSVSLSWPSPLPVPELDGDTAVYPEVFAGVDLRVRALADGFTQVLVIKTRQAAAAAALRLVSYALSGSGLGVHPVPGNGYELVNKAGEALASVAPALMWDSAGGGSPGRLPADDELAGALSSPAGPGVKARTAVPRLSVSAGALEVQPDARVLADPATPLPVFIDPQFVTPWNTWAYASNSGASRDNAVARVGSEEDGSGIFRSFFRFPMWDLQGSQILDARLHATLVHSWSCDNSPVGLYVASPIANYGQVPWNSQPLPLNQAPLVEAWGHAHKGAGACGNQPNMPLQFGGYLPNVVQSSVSAYASWLNLALVARLFNWSTQTAYGESTTSWWKKFDPASVSLVVTFDHRPDTPTLRPVSDCYQMCSSPATVRSLTPTLAAAVHDVDNPTGAVLSTWFEVYDATETTVVAKNTAAVMATSGGSPTWSVPAGQLLNGATYHWRARVVDELNLASDWSAWGVFTVDTMAPDAPTVASSQYPVRQWGAVLGSAGTFTFTGGPDVVDFTWSVDSGATTVTPAAGTGTRTASATFTPGTDMVHTLHVVSHDSAGNTSTSVDHQFWVSPVTARFSHWKLDETSGTAASDSGGGGSTRSPAALSGSVAFAQGYPVSGGSGFGALFTGAGGQITTADPVLDTTRSFSVMAWVRPSDLSAANGNQTVLSQDGTNTSRFVLRYDRDANGGAGGWCFGMRAGDDAAVNPVYACATGTVGSSQPPSVGQWVHLAGVYDAVNHVIQLHVMGNQQSCDGEMVQARFDGNWSATASLVMGRARAAGAGTDYWRGGIDDIYAYQRVLSTEEICQQASQ